MLLARNITDRFYVQKIKAMNSIGKILPKLIEKMREPIKRSTEYTSSMIKLSTDKTFAKNHVRQLVKNTK